MHQVSDYEVYIFDCDGVILDSNQLKIEAMKKALLGIFKQQYDIDNCIEYFKNNFGKSRFHHVDVFLDEYLPVTEHDKVKYRTEILNSYSSMCKVLYLKANLTPDVIEFIHSLSGKKYIASGSEQQELIEVFKHRGLDVLFDGIFGSPITKSENIKNILLQENNTNAIMFGDALSDLNAAIENKIDFIAYTPFSNITKLLEEQTIKHGYPAITKWHELMKKGTI